MPFKYTGKLIGKTLAAAAAADTTPPNRNSPFDAQAPATKFMALGENVTHRSWNRALVALSTNIDALAANLDAPTVRDDILPYYTNAVTGHVGSGKYGFPALVVSNPASVAVANYPEINLGNQGSDTIEPPAVWLYVGLHTKALTDGRTFRFHLDPQENNNISTGAATALNRALYSTILNPAYVKINTGAGSTYHGTQAYVGVSPHSFPDSIPAIGPVKTDLPPYSGGQIDASIASWESDGPVLDGYTWEQLYVRPGCYVKIAGAGTNDGLFYVRSVAGKKAILTSGQLAKVALETTGAASFTAGQLVSWASPPDHTTVGVKISSRSNFAYVVYVDTANDILYLSPVSTSENTSASVNRGSKVANVVSTTDSVTAFSSTNTGDVGLPDAEADATSNWTMPADTRLYPVSYASIGDVTNKQVLGVAAPGEPVVFTTSGNGTATPHSPPGFLLNPVVAMPLITSTSAVRSGKYFISGKTLTTVRERMASAGMSPDLVSNNDPTAVMAGHSRDYLAAATKALFEAMKVGNGDYTVDESMANPWYAPPRNILGNSLWFIRANNGALKIGAKFVDGTLVPGTVIEFDHPSATGALASAKGVVVNGFDDILVVRDVTRFSWDDPDEKHDYIGFKSIDVGSTATVSAVVYTVSALSYPILKTGAGNITSECPAMDLNSTYHRYFSARTEDRAAGGGGEIALASNRPLSLIMPAGVAAQTAVQVLSDETALSLVALKNKALTAKASIGYITDGTDANTALTFTSAGEYMRFNAMDGTQKVLLKYSTGDLKLGVSSSKIIFQNLAGGSGAFLDYSSGTAELGTSSGVVSLQDIAAAELAVLRYGTGTLEIGTDSNRVVLGALDGTDHIDLTYGATGLTAKINGNKLKLSSLDGTKVVNLDFSATDAAFYTTSGKLILETSDGTDRARLNFSSSDLGISAASGRVSFNTMADAARGFIDISSGGVRLGSNDSAYTFSDMTTDYAKIILGDGGVGFASADRTFRLRDMDATIRAHFKTDTDGFVTFATVGGKIIYSLINNVEKMSMEYSTGDCNWEISGGKLILKSSATDRAKILFGTGALQFASQTGTIKLAGMDESLKATIVFGGGTLGFDDANTAATVYFSDSPTESTAIDSVLPQNVVGAISRGGGTATAIGQHIGNTWVSGAACTNGGGLNIAISAGRYLMSGLQVRDTGNVAVPVTNTTSGFIYRQGTEGGAYNYSVAVPAAGNILLAYVTAAGGVITNIYDIRYTNQPLNADTTIIVGGPKAQFATITAALAFINTYKAFPSLSQVQNWKIRVVGAVQEAATVVFPCDNIIIEGVPGAGSTITWGGDQALFDTDGKSGLSFKDLKLTYYDDAALSTTTADRYAFGNAAASASTNIRIERVEIDPLTVSRMHGFMKCATTAGFTNLWIKDCDWKGATMFGAILGSTSLCWISGTTFYTAETTTATTNTFGLSFNTGSNIWVTDCRIEGFHHYGVSLVAVSSVKLRGCTISTVPAAAASTFAYGVYLHSDVTKSVVTENYIEAIGTTGLGAAEVAAGIYVNAGDKNNISNNHIASTIGDGATTNYGIRLQAASNYNIVTGNHTNAKTISDAGTGNVLNNNEDT